MPGKRVLIVDDDPDQVETLAEVLRISGHRVECATNPLFAISLAKEFHPQFIFLDIGLPYMNGYEALARLRRHFSGARFFAITGRAGEGERSKSLEAGFEDHFAKPIDPAVLEALLAG